jgi:hypothetical protein
MQTPFDAFLARVLRTRDALEAAYREHAFRQSLLGLTTVGVAILLAALQMTGGSAHTADDRLVLATVTDGFQSALNTLADIVSVQQGDERSTISDASRGGGGFLSWLFGTAGPPATPPAPPSMPSGAPGSTWPPGGVGVVWASRMLALLNVLLVSLTVVRMAEEPSTVARYYGAYTAYWELAEKALQAAGREDVEAAAASQLAKGEGGGLELWSDLEDGGRTRDAVVSESDFAALREMKATIDKDIHRQRLAPPSATAHRSVAGGGTPGTTQSSVFSCFPCTVDACRWPFCTGMCWARPPGSAAGAMV